VTDDGTRIHSWIVTLSGELLARRIHLRAPPRVISTPQSEIAIIVLRRGTKSRADVAIARILRMSFDSRCPSPRRSVIGTNHVPGAAKHLAFNDERLS
jgi:hypothetical protein